VASAHLVAQEPLELAWLSTTSVIFKEAICDSEFRNAVHRSSLLPVEPKSEGSTSSTSLIE
jgi:hypothetical protein